MGFLDTVIEGCIWILCFIFFDINLSGYPFSRNVLWINCNSWGKQSSVHIHLALLMRHLIKLRLYLKGTKLWKWAYFPTHVNFRWTARLMLPSGLLVRCASRNEMLLFCSTSHVNVIEWWARLESSFVLSIIIFSQNFRITWGKSKNFT